jgi:integrase
MCLSVCAGLRAKEISMVAWTMVLNANGAVGDVLELHNRASKGARGGRRLHLHPELKAALVALYAEQPELPDVPIVGMTTNAVTVWFHRLYARLGLKGASSHSGRRTFLTHLARTIHAKGGSLVDVQHAAVHASVQTTQRYVDRSDDALSKAIEAL